MRLESSLTFQAVTAKEAHRRWHWDGGRYQRFINGAPHLVEGQVPLAADNVIVLATEVRVVDIKPEYQMAVRVQGEGDAYFLRDGRLWRGRWRKNSPADPFQFTIGGAPFPLRPGTTWVEILPCDHIQYEAPAG